MTENKNDVKLPVDPIQRLEFKIDQLGGMIFGLIQEFQLNKQNGLNDAIRVCNQNGLKVDKMSLKDLSIENLRKKRLQEAEKK